MGKNPREAVRIRLLGGFRVSVGARAVGDDRWRLKKAKGVVKLLALAEGHRMHREQLMDLLWPDSSGPKSQYNNLRQALHSARRALESASAGGTPSNGYLRLIEDQVSMCLEGPLWVDAEAFEEAAATARRVGEPAAYRAAVDLYAGELLPEDRYEEWAQERREALRATYLSLLLELARLHEEREEFEGTIEALRKAVVAEPAREETHVRLMRLYGLTGRRQEALVQYERLRKALSEGLGGEEEPGEAGRLLYEEIRAGRAPAIEPPARQERSHEMAPGDPPGRHNLPVEQTSFVGREEEMVEVERLLSMTGLLTLTGAGGSGKTRFALALARELVGTYEDGAWLVELAPLSDPELVERAVAGVLGVTEQPGRPLTDTLKDHLSSKKLLLVMDNCEHLVEAAARLADTLLGSCPKLKVLATSREPLNVAGELVWRVPSLSIPEHSFGGSPKRVEKLARYESVRLFVERARYRQTSFGLTPENASAVAEVCRRLEGIPLAIELAAARVGVLSVGQIVARLKDSLGVLTGGSRTAEPRQRTLRGTLEWSYELLGDLERDLFERLSVFRGGCTLEAAEAMGAEPGSGIEGEDVLDLLSRLVDKSLVTAEVGGVEGELRYRMLEPVRQYGLERLEESGEARRSRQRHAEYFLALTEEAEPHLKGAQQAVWLERLEIEQDNLRAALSWSLDQGDTNGEDRAELGLRLAAALWLFWNVHGLGEGHRWLEAALEKSNVRSSVRAKALNGAGWTTLYRGDYEQAVARLEEGVALFKELGDKSGAAISLAYLGRTVVHQGDKRRIEELRQEAEVLRWESLDRRAVAELLFFLGAVARHDSAYERSVALCEESLSLFRELGDTRAMTRCINGLGTVALEHGYQERAAALLEEGLHPLRELRDTTGISFSLLGLAGVAGSRGEPIRAARLWGAAEALRENIGLSLGQYERSHYDYEARLIAARAQLDEARWEAAWAEGRAMTPEQAVEYALSEEMPLPTKASAPEEWPTDGGQRPDALTPREREVAILVAQELTNRQIAKELVISERTVATYVHKILDKLNLRSRVQIAAWAMEQELLR